MAFHDIVQSGGIMSFDRTNVGSFIDIIASRSQMFFPLVIGGGGGGGLATRVIGSPIIRKFK